jgi:hypothetical protein
MSANNHEVRLRNEFAAEEKVSESLFDKVWKVISQQASIAEEERKTFRATYVEIMNAQQGIAGKGALASFFSQAKVDVSPDLFSKLMTTIEAQRESFHRQQQKLAQIKMQHDNVRLVFPSSLFVGGRPPLELRIISSDKTRGVFETGTDNDVELFKK